MANNLLAGLPVALVQGKMTNILSYAQGLQLKIAFPGVWQAFFSRMKDDNVDFTRYMNETVMTGICAIYSKSGVWPNFFDSGSRISLYDANFSSYPSVSPHFFEILKCNMNGSFVQVETFREIDDARADNEVAEIFFKSLAIPGLPEGLHSILFPNLSDVNRCVISPVLLEADFSAREMLKTLLANASYLDTYLALVFDAKESEQAILNKISEMAVGGFEQLFESIKFLAI